MTVSSIAPTHASELPQRLRRAYERPRRGPEWVGRYRLRLVLLDALVIIASGLIASLLRFGEADVVISGSSAQWLTYEVLEVLVAVGWLATLALVGAYDRRVFGIGSDEYKRVLHASLTVAALVGLSSYLARIDIARGWVIIALPLGTAALVLGRWTLRRYLHRGRGQGRSLHRTLVVGDPEHALHMVSTLQREAHAGYQVVGLCLPDDARVLDDPGVPIVGTLGSIRESVIVADADTIAVAGSLALTPALLRRLSWEVEGLGVDLVVSPSLVDVAGPRVHIRPLAGLPLIQVDTPEFAGWRRVGKAVIDHVGGSVLLLLALPLFAGVALAIKLDDGGPVFYRQYRVGQYGGLFRMIKFRSMSTDADARRRELEHLNEADGPLFKVKHDPRVTRVGRILRQWSLDEMPQLVNVLMGDMSLLGPRPPLPEEAASYGEDASRRLLVKPGMTGLWQVSGRSGLSWKDGLRADLWYVENWSLTQDMIILVKTARAVLARDGAY